MTSLQVICGLPPQSKILATPMRVAPSVLGLERVCPREVGRWPWSWIFFLSSWPRTLGPRLPLRYLTRVTEVKTLSNPDFECDYRTTF